MDLKIIYQDDDVLVVDKPAGVVVFAEAKTTQKSLIDYLLDQFPDLKNAGEAPRYGIVHRLDKNTSGVLLVAKTQKALIFLQKQFKNREVGKKYLALATGAVEGDSGSIETLLGRSPSDKRKQKAYPLAASAPKGATAGQSKRLAITKYKVLERFKNYTLLEVTIETGRKHQIRVHLAYIHHPVAGDEMYGFKDSPKPEGLDRQFLHAEYIKIMLPSGKIQEFHSELPQNLKEILNNLKT